MTSFPQDKSLTKLVRIQGLFPPPSPQKNPHFLLCYNMSSLAHIEGDSCINCPHNNDITSLRYN